MLGVVGTTCLQNRTRYRQGPGFNSPHLHALCPCRQIGKAASMRCWCLQVQFLSRVRKALKGVKRSSGRKPYLQDWIMMKFFKPRFLGPYQLRVQLCAFFTDQDLLTTCEDRGDCP